MDIVDEINTKNALRITNAWLSEVKYEAPYFGCGDMNAIKKALEKQIPKKVVVQGQGQEAECICPNCGKVLGIDANWVYDQTKCCSECGQALEEY